MLGVSAAIIGYAGMIVFNFQGLSIYLARIFSIKVSIMVGSLYDVC